MKRILAAIVIAAAGASASGANAAEDMRIFKYLSVDADYADWGEAEESYTWEAEGWIGGDAHKAWLKSEGEHSQGELEEAEVQLLYSRPISDFWDVQAGIRQDFEPDDTTYLAVALNGLAPYFIESDLSFFLSEDGDASARIEGAIELLITQDLVLEPYAELEFAFQDVDERELGSGFTDVDTGIRLLYHVTRKFAPYVDFNYVGHLGQTRDIAKAAGEDPDAFVIRAGLHFWLN